MEQRDYILKEIEKISVLILALIGRLRQTDTRRLFADNREMLGKEFDIATGFSVDEILSMDKEEMLSRLDKTEGYNAINLEYLADLLILFAANLEEEQRKSLHSKALGILKYIDATTKTFSFERFGKISDLSHADI